MKRIIQMVTIPRQSDSLYHTDLLGFWVLLSLEMIYAHGLKKIGIGITEVLVFILALTLTGYFVLHFRDALLVKDASFMYSLSYLVILFLAAGKTSLDSYFFKKFSR